MKTHLTDITVKTLKPSDRQTDYFCMQTKNFGLRVSPGGTKTFFVLTGPAEARRRVRIGTYPNITLKAARKAAALTINQPVTPGVPTYETALTAYLDVIRQNYRARSAYLTERHLTLHVTSLYPKQLTDLTAQDVYQLLKPLPPSEANHTFGALKTFLNWAAARYTVLNPLQNSHKPHKETSRDRTPTDAEVKAVWHACPDSQFGSIVKALILSGQRRSQIAALQSSWMSDDVITFPKDIMKSKAEHTFPLTPALKAVLRPDVYYNGWGKHKAALDKASGTSGWTLHDLRRYFSSTCAELGIPQHVTELILAHKVGGTETQISKVYNRYTTSRRCVPPWNSTRTMFSGSWNKTKQVTLRDVATVTRCCHSPYGSVVAGLCRARLLIRSVNDATIGNLQGPLAYLAYPVQTTIDLPTAAPEERAAQISASP